MGVTPISSLAEFKQIIAQDKVSIFDFWATWCGPCKVISPIFEKLSDQFETIGFYKVDVDAASEISEDVGIRAMPTFIAFRNDNVLGKVVGASPKDLQALIEKSA